MAGPTRSASPPASPVRRYLLPAIFALIVFSAILFTTGKFHPYGHPRDRPVDASSTSSRQSRHTSSTAGESPRFPVRILRPKDKTTPEERALLAELANFQNGDPFADWPEEAYKKLAFLWVQRDPAEAVRRAHAMDDHPELLEHIAHEIATHHGERWAEFFNHLPETASGERIRFLGAAINLLDSSNTAAVWQQVVETLAKAEDRETTNLLIVEKLAEKNPERVFPLLEGAADNIYQAFFATASYPDPRTAFERVQSLPKEKWDTCLAIFPGKAQMATLDRRSFSDFIESSPFSADRKDSMIVRTLFQGGLLAPEDEEIVTRIQNDELREDIIEALATDVEDPEIRKSHIERIWTWFENPIFKNPDYDPFR